MNELRQALELATEEELQDLTDLLFRRRYNPLDYLREPTPGQVQAASRQSLSLCSRRRIYGPQRANGNLKLSPGAGPG